VAFNGQGQWRQKSWEAFKSWVTLEQKSIDKRLHLLRYKSAITRRRLTNLLNNLPPSFTKDVQNNSSFAIGGDDNLPAFKEEWEPRAVPIVGPTILLPVQNPKQITGVEVLGVKELFQKEIRGIEYSEHLIQKTRFEIERLENEIYWLECSKTKIEKHIKVVDTQFNHLEFSDSLLKTGSVARLSMHEDASDALVQKMREGEYLLKTYEKARGNAPIPETTPNSSTVANMTGSADPVPTPVNLNTPGSDSQDSSTNTGPRG
jgi:hypothetical protein